MLNLLELPDKYLAKYGAAKIAEITGSTPALLGMWKKRGKFPVDALQKLLDFDPFPIAEIKPLYENPTTHPKVAVLMPVQASVHPYTMESLMGIYSPSTFKIKTHAFWSAYHARDFLANWFLRDSGCEIAFWVDSDMVLPHGNAERFNQMGKTPNYPVAYGGINAFNRMLFHGKSLIGVAYKGKEMGARFQFHGSDSMEMIQEVKRGPRNEVIARDWVGFGAVLMKRNVLEDIISKMGNDIRYPTEGARKRFGEYSFFSPHFVGAGDDVSFCARAKLSGHQPYVDMSIFAPHMGNHPFTFADS